MQADQPNQAISQQINAENVYLHGGGNQADNKKTCRCSLPSRQPFFGREEELERIAEALHPDSRSWGVLIDGPGGIGKTALALESGHRAPEGDFSHKLFLSAKIRELLPEGEQPLDDYLLPNFLALLNQLALELGESPLDRLDPKERADTMRRSLANTRALLIIDNLETFAPREQARVFQFLDRLPPSCKAIVTSRRRTDIRGGVPIRLDRLKQDAALALLDNLAQHFPRLAKSDQAARIRLYETANGNPLLMRWIVGQLGRGQCRTLEDACEFLNHAPPDNDPLEYIFGDLLDTFTDSESAALCALAHFRDFAEVRWIAELADKPETPIRTALEDLAERALLLADAHEERFFLPPLAARFIRNKRPEAVKRSGERLEEKVYALVMENGYQNYERFSELEKEWTAIAAALPYFLEGDNRRLQKLCNAINNFILFSGRWDERLYISQQAELKAESMQDWYNAGYRVYDSGYISYLRGQPIDILACALRASQYWKRANCGVTEEAMSTRLQGLGYGAEKNYPAAINLIQEALVLFRGISAESDEVAITLNNLALLEKKSCNYVSAENHYHEALHIAKKVNSRVGIANYASNLAGLAIAQEKWTEAETWAVEAMQLAESIGREELIADACQQFAYALARQNRAKEGLPYAKRAVQIYSHLRIDPDEMEKALTALRECEAGVAKISEP
jgi:tetratricopeptide (TPR) repeat protein